MTDKETWCLIYGIWRPGVLTSRDSACIGGLESEDAAYRKLAEVRENYRDDVYQIQWTRIEKESHELR